jgi:hypothetical protein
MARRLQEEDNPMKLFKVQGMALQVRITEHLPVEINELLATFDEQRQRDKELAEAKEKRNVEVR